VDNYTIRIHPQQSSKRFCAIAMLTTKSGEKWIINAEGKTFEDALSNLQFRLKNWNMINSI
jgi:phosphotransferase system HPr-like phosphotransfer protein